MNLVLLEEPIGRCAFQCFICTQVQTVGKPCSDASFTHLHPESLLTGPRLTPGEYLMGPSSRCLICPRNSGCRGPLPLSWALGVPLSAVLTLRNVFPSHLQPRGILVAFLSLCSGHQARIWKDPRGGSRQENEAQHQRQALSPSRGHTGHWCSHHTPRQQAQECTCLAQTGAFQVALALALKPMTSGPVAWALWIQSRLCHVSSVL